MGTAPTATASATAVSATATTGNLPHPHYVHIRGHHVPAGCLGVGIQRAARAKISAAARRFLSKSRKTLRGLSTRLKVCVLSFRGSLIWKPSPFNFHSPRIGETENQDFTFNTTTTKTKLSKTLSFQKKCYKTSINKGIFSIKKKKK